MVEFLVKLRKEGKEGGNVIATVPFSLHEQLKVEKIKPGWVRLTVNYQEGDESCFSVLRTRKRSLQITIPRWAYPWTGHHHTVRLRLENVSPFRAKPVNLEWDWLPFVPRSYLPVHETDHVAILYSAHNAPYKLYRSMPLEIAGRLLSASLSGKGRFASGLVLQEWTHTDTARENRVHAYERLLTKIVTNALKTKKGRALASAALLQSTSV